MKLNESTIPDLMDQLSETEFGQRAIVRAAIKIVAEHGTVSMDWVRQMHDGGGLTNLEIDEAQMQFEDFKYSDELKED